MRSSSSPASPRTPLSRRTLLQFGLIGGATALLQRAARAAGYMPDLAPTPSEIKGPFYPIVAQQDKDFDLTQVAGHSARAKGTIIVIEGQVVDTENQAIAGASVEIWQAAASGRYNHPHDPNTAPVDPDFQGWAVVPSGVQGAFRFQTVMPGAYPAAPDWMRPPHIHFKVSKLGYVELITQMYFPNDPLNDKDLLLLRKGPEERKLMIAEAAGAAVKGADSKALFRYRIVLQKA